MNSKLKKPFRLGIALRIALLTWLVALITLLFFVLTTLPREKRIYLQNLESKAKSVAVSLRDVAAGAAINEDFAGVVNACQTLLAGDPEIDFLVVMKNDGFALINDQAGWKVEEKIEPYWNPAERKTSADISEVPLLNRRVFHYAQPFDYSGIQWGWIHVGLSLKAYDQSVHSLYQHTLLLSLGCVALSLLISLAYASRLVRPILRLRQAVERVAGGDLSVRVEISGSDELSSLAGSVNSMTDSLLRRDRILESVRFAAQRFMVSEQWQEAITEVLARLGRAADASRAYLFENSHDETGRLCMSQRFEWTVDGIEPQLSNPDLQMLPYTEPGLDFWRTTLGGNHIISGPVDQMSEPLRAVLEPQNILSLIVIPVFVEKRWWGFLGLDDCHHARVWTDAEEDSLRAATDMLGATIARQGIQQALLESKATLEQRVEERTRELQTQVSAKEKALSELAATQSSLLEASRVAGMAEVATGVLHNVGNVLNSVNVSCNLLVSRLQKSRIGNVTKVAELMNRNAGQLATFLTEDPRGSQIPAYLDSLAANLEEERQGLLGETESLRERVDHIKEIVAMQQSYGRVSGVDETIDPAQLMEDAIKLNAGSLERHGVTVRREYRPLPPMLVDKHKVLQILLNLIKNAKQACSEVEGEKVLILRVDNPEPEIVRFQVGDNGIGIPSENLTRIFQHGFTTRNTGHGFGLHSGALAARELGGRLHVYSDGLHAGATFTLELPYHSGGRT
ncbi:MAG: HAMP domain-containing protein [Syntrophotaleaceae bacterium]